MSEQAGIMVIEGLLALAVLVWFFYGPWPSLMVDTARQRLFEIRDELFLMAADGKIDRESEAYQLMRDWLNASIRFAHHATIGQLAAYGAAYGRDAEPVSALDRAISKIEDAEIRADLKARRVATGLVMINLMTVRSPVVLVWVVILAPFFLLSELLSGKPEKVIAKIRRLLEADIERSEGLGGGKAHAH